MASVTPLPGLRVEFPGGEVLRFGGADLPPEALHAITVHRDGSTWRVKTGWPSGEAAGKAKDALVYVQRLSPARSAKVHPVLDSEIMVVETSNNAPVKIEWEKREEREEIAAETAGHKAGTRWIDHQGASLAVGVLPRNLLDPDQWANPHTVSEAVEGALKTLRAMVSDLLSAKCELGPDPDDATNADPGLAAGVDMSRRIPTGRAAQRLHRLQRLLEEGGVLDAWAAMLADPDVQLTSEHPVKPLHRARRPEFSGVRGPWAVANGWSPVNRLGRVHDRRVLRTVDTAPNRLAVQLAARVRAELDLIERALPPPCPYAAGIDRLRRQALAVERAPAFAAVSRVAQVPLDSPSLHANRRCQPLLRAWIRFDRDLRVDHLIPFDEVALEPLHEVHHLYELWCAQRLRALLEKLLEKERGPAVPTREGRWVRYVWGPPGRTIVLAASLDPGQPDDGDGEVWKPDSPCDGASCTEKRAGGRFRSWGLVSLPDGYLWLETGCGGNGTMIIWDAKYRRVKHWRYLASLTYQAHAFRDAIRVIDSETDSEKGEGRAPQWSLVLHPTPQAADLLLREGGHGKDRLELTEFGNALIDRAEGVGILRARPAEDDKDDEEDPLRRLVEQLVASQQNTATGGVP